MWLTWTNLEIKDSFQRKYRMVHFKLKGARFSKFLCIFKQKEQHFCYILRRKEEKWTQFLF